MYDYLMRKDVSVPIAEATIARLSELGLLDDAAFAMSWVANRQLLKPRSRRQLEQELMTKGVSRGDIAMALADLGEDGEIAGLVELAEKKRRLPQYQEESKLMGYLARQGFSYERIKRALELIAERSLD
jgi:regulatory protein